jgi:hypothetical protein
LTFVLNSHNPAARTAEANLALLRTVAARLGELREKVMFLGGTIVPLLVSEAAASDVRVAKDVDFMVHAPTKAELWEIEDEFWDVGMKRRSLGAACHWRLGEIDVDVLTTEPYTVELPNSWGLEAMRNTLQRDLGGGLLINIMRSTHYMGIKFDAFRCRGNGNYGKSRDIYDIRLVLRGCPDIERDLQHTSPELRSHLVAELQKLLKRSEPGGRDFQHAERVLTSIHGRTMQEEEARTV